MDELVRKWHSNGLPYFPRPALFRRVKTKLRHYPVPVQLWLVAYPRGTVRRISNDLTDYSTVAVSADGRTIAAVQRNTSSALWIGPASTPDAVHQISSGRLDGTIGSDFTPDGRIIYNPSGNWELFVMDTAGGNSRQLAFDGHFHASPAVCDSGRTVVYSSDFDGTSHLFKLDLHKGTSTKLTNGSGEDGPRCGAARDRVFFRGQLPTGAAHIYAVPLNGSEPTRVSQRIAVSTPNLSPDGSRRWFAGFCKDGKLCSINLSTDTHNAPTESESRIRATVDQSPYSACPMPDNHSLAATDIRTGVPNLWAISQVGDAPDTQLTHFTSGEIWDRGYSPDGKQILIARGTNLSDVVLFTSAK